MKVYFVRHAESQLNAERVHQHKDVPLHQRGLKQAEALAKRLKSLNVEVVVASPYLRTKETAEKLAEEIGKPVQFYDGLVEIKRPTEMAGKRTTDREVLAIQAEIVKHFNEGDWKYSDEESFNELKVRGLRILDYLVKINKEKVLVVAHAAIIRVIVACIMFGEKLTPREYQGLWCTVISNAGVTIAEYNPAEFSKMHPWGSPWKIITLNEQGHLE